MQGPAAPTSRSRMRRRQRFRRTPLRARARSRAVGGHRVFVPDGVARKGRWRWSGRCVESISPSSPGKPPTRPRNPGPMSHGGRRAPGRHETRHLRAPEQNSNRAAERMLNPPALGEMSRNWAWLSPLRHPDTCWFFRLSYATASADDGRRATAMQERRPGSRQGPVRKAGPLPRQPRHETATALEAFVGAVRDGRPICTVGGLVRRGKAEVSWTGLTLALSC